MFTLLWQIETEGSGPGGSAYKTPLRRALGMSETAPTFEKSQTREKQSPGPDLGQRPKVLCLCLKHPPLPTLGFHLHPHPSWTVWASFSLERPLQDAEEDAHHKITPSGPSSAWSGWGLPCLILSLFERLPVSQWVLLRRRGRQGLLRRLSSHLPSSD